MSDGETKAAEAREEDDAPRDRALGRSTTLVTLVGLPLIIGFGMALRHGVSLDARSEERSMVGEGRFAELTDGDDDLGFPHYVGHDRLAPEFELQRYGSDAPWSLADHRGKVVVVNFWSDTCPPCIEEMPSIERLAHLVRPWGDVEVVAIATDASWEATKIEEHLPQWVGLAGLSDPDTGRAEPQVTYLLDPDKHVSRELFGSELYPETWIIDREGVIRFRYDGAFDWSSALAVDLIDSYR